MEDIFIHNELKDLIPIAINYLKKRKLKILLFSPACSSFDQFKDYEDRGNYFKCLVKKYLCIQIPLENLNKTLEVGHYNQDRTGTYLTKKVKLNT